MKNTAFYTPTTATTAEKRLKRARIYVAETDETYLQEIEDEYATLGQVSKAYKLSRSQTYKTLRACQRFTVIVTSSGKHKTAQFTVVRWRDVHAIMGMRGRKGNQLFYDHDFQQEMALRRWYPVDIDNKPNPDIRRSEG